MLNDLPESPEGSKRTLPGAMATALSGHAFDESCPRKAVGMAPNPAVCASTEERSELECVVIVEIGDVVCCNDVVCEVLLPPAETTPSNAFGELPFTPA